MITSSVGGFGHIKDQVYSIFDQRAKGIPVLYLGELNFKRRVSRSHPFLRLLLFFLPLYFFYPPLLFPQVELSLRYFLFCGPFFYIRENKRVVGIQCFLQVVYHAVVSPMLCLRRVDQKPIVICHFVFHCDQIVLGNQPENLSCIHIKFFRESPVNLHDGIAVGKQ